MKKIFFLSLFAVLPLCAQDADHKDHTQCNREVHRQRLIKHFDKDGDGQLNDEEKAALQNFLETRSEKGARPSREEIIKRFDKDGDGQLNDEEKKAMREEMGKKGHPHGKRGGARPSREEIIKRFDKDGDGQLNDEEKKAMREEMGKRGHRGAKQGEE